jgi:hypothetical protein
MNDEPQSQLLLYQTEDGKTRLEVRLENETVWLTQNQMAELFQTSIPNVSMHIRNVFAEGELQPGSVVKEFLTTAADGKNYQTKFYNLDVIISVGYRVKSHRGTQFRIWATQRLREYIVKGFALDGERFKRAGGGNYFEELLARILAYAQEIGWTYVPCVEAEARRGFTPHPSPLPQGERENAEDARKVSLFFGDLLHAQVRAFNPKYKDAEGALIGEFQRFHAESIQLSSRKAHMGFKPRVRSKRPLARKVSGPEEILSSSSL